MVAIAAAHSYLRQLSMAIETFCNNNGRVPKRVTLGHAAYDVLRAELLATGRLDPGQRLCQLRYGAALIKVEITNGKLSIELE